MASDALAILVAFLCGSIPFGVILVFLFRGIDVRRVGSGNIGATNAMRAGGAWVGVAVLALDALKGVVGVLLGRAVAGGAGGLGPVGEPDQPDPGAAHEVEKRPGRVGHQRLGRQRRAQVGDRAGTVAGQRVQRRGGGFGAELRRLP